MLRKLLWGAVLASSVGLAACSGQGDGPAPGAPEVVPAAEAATMPGGEVAGRYWVEGDPKTGSLSIYPIHPGNLIYRAEKIVSAVNFQYTTATKDPNCTDGTCLPSINTVGLFTDQNTVSYVQDNQGVDDGNPADDTCVRNGVTFMNDPTCGGFYQAGAACTKSHTFCGKIQITSNVTFGGAVGAMPDVVLDIGNPAGTTPAPILGCRRNNTLGGTGGLCVDDGPAKVAAATSNFVPQIAAAAGTNPCPYCYGNKAQAVATNRPALQNAVVSGSSAEKAAVDANTVVLKLVNADNFSATFTVYYATPALNAPNAQLAFTDTNNATLSCISQTRPNRVVVKGGGFGPPADCVAATFPGSCPLVGAPATGYNVDFAGLTGHSPLEWSDTQLRSNDLPVTMYGCPVTVHTPLGSVVTDDDLKICSGTFRTYTSTGYLGRTRFVGGVLNSFVVVLGGLSNPSQAAGTSTIQAMPLPRCANPSPSFTTLGTTLPAGAGLWGAAGAVASDGLYYVGGADSGNTCSAQAFRFTYTGGATGTLTRLPDLPVQLCHATAVNLFDADSADGSEYIAVTGGLTRPLFRTPNTPAPSAGDFAPQTTYLWKIGGSSWTTAAAGRGLLRYNMGGAGYRDADASKNRALFVGGAVTVANTAPAVNTVDSLQVIDGVPFYNFGGSPPVLPAARSAPAVTLFNNNIYVSGGSTEIGPQTAGRREMYRIAGASGGAWVTVSTGGPLARQGHILVTSNFDETPPADDLVRLLAVGGNDSSIFRINDEYNP
jgi:hypothetical protein